MHDQTCRCDGCTEPVATFKHFPTVVGYCSAHGEPLVRFITLIDLPAHVIIGFDAARARWENRARFLGTL